MVTHVNYHFTNTPYLCDIESLGIISYTVPFIHVNTGSSSSQRHSHKSIKSEIVSRSSLDLVLLVTIQNLRNSVTY